ncbi:putative O-glycosylation ligase, exosortase A system-associated [Ferribacterium limneticum]|uniref:putative O-glycosylation ligase, exosortase A system-associated n=1 Tax=Ferribacterium limneticum TaxID=76259 RepID=UPI001CF8966F|nr:putative O-glycosylation ligase, exosortase A system-associated [Ferribacterium limneticum]UCV24730.1 putative O-glycosylation ligase, exosortase A system-associated [Ferribacterium limneticum]
MRDLLVVGIVLFGSLYALRQPWVGAILWAWVSLMNPHNLAFGFAHSFPVAAIVAVATMIGVATTKDRQNPFDQPPVIWLALFLGWMCFTYPFSYNVEGSTDMLTKIVKIDLMTLVTLMVLKTRRHIEIFVWVVAGSLAFYGVKGGIFTIINGGNYRVWGPGGFIGGNNELALALIMIIPLIRFIQLQVTKTWMRRACSAAMLLTAAAALGSHSRGALLGIAAMAIYLWLKSPKKLGFGIGMVIAGMGLVLFMPEEWSARMNSIQDYEQDASSMGRINAWWAAFNVAKAHITGAGFDMYTYEIFARFAPNPLDLHAAHSIYFQVLGEQGFIGLFLFIGMWYSAWRMAGSIIRYKTNDPDRAWCKVLAAMCQVSLIGYAVGGAFLSLAYFDLPYDILVIIVLVKKWMFAGTSADPAVEKDVSITQFSRKAST